MLLDEETFEFKKDENHEGRTRSHVSIVSSAAAETAVRHAWNPWIFQKFRPNATYDVTSQEPLPSSNMWYTRES